MTWPRVWAGASRLAVARLPMKTAPTATPLTTVARQEEWHRRGRQSGHDQGERRQEHRKASHHHRPGRQPGPGQLSAGGNRKCEEDHRPRHRVAGIVQHAARKVGTSELKSPSRRTPQTCESGSNELAPACSWNSEAAELERQRGALGHRLRHEKQGKSRHCCEYELGHEWPHVGSDEYCASSPAIRGPRPRPPMLAVVETSERAEPEPDRAVSVSAAVAVPVINPADRPDSTRPREQPADTGREDERHRAGDAQHNCRRQHRTPANLVRHTPGAQQRCEHAHCVDGEDQRDETGREMPLCLVDNVQGSWQGGTEHRDCECVGDQPERDRPR